jgi:hypothetical protein
MARPRGWRSTRHNLPDDAAALAHAIRIIQELKQGGGHDDRRIMMIVRNEKLKTVLSLPFHAGCA